MAVSSTGPGDESPLTGWLREMRDSASADLRLMRDRADSFRSRADRELGNFFNSATALSAVVSSPPPAISTATPIAEIEFMKRIQPKLSEFRRNYSSPEKVLERWGYRASISIDLSAIKKAIIAEVDELNGAWEFTGRQDAGTRRMIRWMELSAMERGREREEENVWEPIRILRTSLKEFERKTQSSEIFESFKNNEFVEKMKLSLKTLQKDFQQSKEVPPLDLSEIFAYFVRQSGPFLDQLGVRRELCGRIVDALCRRKDQPLYHSRSGSETALYGFENFADELDLRIASVLHSTGHHYDGFWLDPSKHEISEKKRHVAIVTTASLPWMTGTAVNPLFRAAYLAKSTKQDVTLVVPWLCKSDQELVYPNNLTFNSPEEQETYMRSWLEERLGFKSEFRISFYPGRFSKERRSIIPAGDTSQFISSKEADIAILEEPEHLNWYHHGNRWTDKFNHVIGVVHTNYLEYIKREKNGAIQAFLVKHINNWVARAYCDKVLRLSAATQDLPKSVVCNVHGVNPKFLKVGEKIAAEKESGQPVFSKGAYFLGKMVWAKGYKELIDLLSKHKKELEGFALDVYGSGEDSDAVQSTAKSLSLSVNFFKGRDHADDTLHGYKVFVNPSISDVLCTATAEALAMGKFVICADHPSNDFFRQFPNCLTYKTSEEFVSRVKEAMSCDPEPLTPEQRFKLSWEAATERFMETSELDKVLSNPNYHPRKGGKKNSGMRNAISMPNLSEVVDGGLAFAHYCLTGSELLRLATGAIPGTRDYNRQQCEDLNLLPPEVQHPVYGW